MDDWQISQIPLSCSFLSFIPSPSPTPLPLPLLLSFTRMRTLNSHLQNRIEKPRCGLVIPCIAPFPLPRDVDVDPAPYHGHVWCHQTYVTQTLCGRVCGIGRREGGEGRGGGGGEKGERGGEVREEEKGGEEIGKCGEKRERR